VGQVLLLYFNTKKTQAKTRNQDRPGNMETQTQDGPGNIINYN